MFIRSKFEEDVAMVKFGDIKLAY